MTFTGVRESKRLPSSRDIFPTSMRGKFEMSDFFQCWKLCGINGSLA